MKIIVGLGNRDKKYDGTRHNVGFFALGHYASEHNIDFSLKDRFKAVISELTQYREKVLLVMPTTYYNNVGESVRSIMDFYKVEPSDILVIHDELALPFGTIRTRIGGSDAGNNGVKSINQHCGTDTSRIRIGIYTELRDRIDDASFVLSPFTQQESAELKLLIPDVIHIIDSFISGKFEVTTRQKSVA